MCSFLVSSWMLANLTYINYYMQPRGPDLTSLHQAHGFTFVHNLLHMTGDRVAQPFTDSAAQIAAVYNGEIYNYKSLAGAGARWRSDGESLIPLYLKHGLRFTSIIEGEFAIALFDFERHRAILSTDTFSTKPLWYSTYQGFHVASYKSALLRLGAPETAVHMVNPNTVLVFDLNSDEYKLVGSRTLYEFDLRQFKEHTADFQSAFERAVHQRVENAIHPVFIGLSSGYDSGAIQVALTHQGHAHFAYTVYSTEDIETLTSRINWAAEAAETNVIVLSGQELEQEAQRLSHLCEPFMYRAKRGQEVLVAEDQASFGLSYIFTKVRKRGILVYLSGTGADEIISDYGFNGTKIFPHSNFGGLFPSNLTALFPWESFFLGTQRDYLMKEELVAGVHGIEARYPFLDRRVVQEFLWLSENVKNSKYKAPIHDLLQHFSYPFKSGEKLGFNAAHNVHWNEQKSQVFTYYARSDPKDTKPMDIATSTESTLDQARLASAAGMTNTDVSVPTMARQDQSLPEASRDESHQKSLQAWEQRLVAREEAVLDAQQQISNQVAQLQTQAEDINAAQQHLQQQAALVDAQWRQLRQQAAELQAQQHAQTDSYLRFMALRLVPIRHTAETLRKEDLLKTPLTAPATGSDLATMESFDTGHPMWSGVEVLTCVSGGRFLKVMDFPVYHIFRASTPLPVHNVCENVEWEGMHMRLRLYKKFLAEHNSRNNQEHGRQRLFVVSDGMDVIFNSMQEVIKANANLQKHTAAEAVSLLIIQRYEDLVGHASPGRAVFSSERLCGWGGEHLCTDEDDARYPAAPTDSKYLNAGGYIGPADLLESIIDSVLKMIAQAKLDASMGNLRAKTTAEGAAGGETDQYFFKLYFWEHPEKVVLDYQQSIFGNFLEVEQQPCYDGWSPRCAVQPCCTVSDNFERFHEVFFGRYEVRKCSIWRLGNLPMSWHGNGAGKWMWLIALEELSRSCPYVANLTIQKYPLEPIEQLFKGFDAARTLKQQQMQEL